MSWLGFLWVLVCFLLMPGQVWAHSIEVGQYYGFMAGLTHPVLGLDHLLAMVSVGVVSAQMGGDAIWKVPLTFVCVMFFGGMAGSEGMAIPLIEYGIAFSVFFLGIAVAMEKNFPVVAAMFGVGLFAVFHGYAHGMEIPYLAKPLLYALGFMSGTAGLHIFGVAIGLVAEKVKNGAALLRYVGAGVAGMGLCIVLEII